MVFVAVDVSEALDSFEVALRTEREREPNMSFTRCRERPRDERSDVDVAQESIDSPPAMGFPHYSDVLPGNVVPWVTASQSGTNEVCLFPLDDNR